MLAASGASAADEKELQARLQRTTSVTCRFTAMAAGDWPAGVPAPAIRPASLSVAFDHVNVEEGSARVAAQVGSIDVITRFANGVLHFMESFREGALYVTSVFPVQAGQTALAAVHSRHEFTRVQVPGYTSRPEQYYGSCDIDR